MKHPYYKSRIFLASLIASAVLAVSAAGVRAALVPNMILTAPSAGSDAVQVTVYGADPNVSVLLYHPSASSYVPINIGTTNQSGYLLTTVVSGTYGITPGSPVYVMVNNQQSQTQNWPSYTSTGSLSLSQTNITLSTGQATTVSAAVSASLSVQSNSNASVASTYINGNQIVVTGGQAGTTNIVICAGGIGCGTIYVTVQSNATTPASISFSQSTVSMNAGQSQTVTISGSGSFYVSSNSNGGAVSTNLVGSTLTLNALNAGTSVLSVCASGNNSTSCGTINVTVSGTSNANTTTSSSNQSAVSFSPSEADISVGQNMTVAIYGAGTYYVSSNSNQNAVTANINGNNITVYGVAIGGANINICQITGGCGNLYVYVAPTGSAQAAPSSTAAPVSQTPVLSSFSVSSNGTNSFTGAGSSLTLTFNVNQTINTPTVTLAGSRISVNGSGSGPYTASYYMTGNEGFPLPINITFTNPAGTGGQAYFWIGNSPASPASGTAVSSQASSAASSAQSASSGSYYFGKYLYEGMMKLGQADSDVTALQSRLAADGLYSGPVTGYFGPLTKAAVQRYQTKNGLSAIGVVGPSTRSLLNKGI